MKTVIKGLLFDKDGTLFDFRTTWGSWTAQLLAELGAGDASLTNRLAQVWGFDLIARDFLPGSMIIAETPENMVKAIAAHLPDWKFEDLLQHILVSSSHVPLIEAVPLQPLLREFRHRGLKIGLSTNDGEAPATAHLNAVGIAGMFDFIAGSDSGFGGKPEPGMQHGFCAAVGLPAQQVAMVGDSLHDLVAGRAAGMRTIGVLTGMSEAKVLAPKADVVLNDIGKIPHLLDTDWNFARTT